MSQFIPRLFGETSVFESPYREPSQRLNYQDIYAALKWAKNYLSIKADITQFFDVLFPDPANMSAGWYEPKKRHIFFNGYPELTTVFHETVHWWQHEQDVDFDAIAASMKDEYPTSPGQQYFNSPIEKEARWKSYQMVDAYSGKPERSPSFWIDKPGRPSDHTYY